MNAPLPFHLLAVLARLRRSHPCPHARLHAHTHAQLCATGQSPRLLVPVICALPEASGAVLELLRPPCCLLQAVLAIPCICPILRLLSSR